MTRRPRPSNADLTAEAIHAAVCTDRGPLPPIDSQHGRTDRAVTERFLNTLHSLGQSVGPSERAEVLSPDFLFVP
jgi:hypothetical protein